MMMFGYWPMGGMMWIWVLIFGGFCYWGWGWFNPRRHRYNSYRNDPIEIARERLARGEITPQEYDEIKKTLERER
ncbi:SHOCT domain-containing protein [Candidatus Bathyarchaeota archaeon]|nr:SHOCT domain-containing protein [Candidatus Bathyarchaeota archaeon]